MTLSITINSYEQIVLDAIRDCPVTHNPEDIINWLADEREEKARFRDAIQSLFTQGRIWADLNYHVDIDSNHKN